MSPRYLLDKSAFARWNQKAVAEVLDPLHRQGVLAVAAPAVIELTHSARNKQEAERLRWELSGFDYLNGNEEVWGRALDIQQLAFDAGFHRALSMADLMIAATAERHRAVILHYDGDYDMITSLTRQPTQWVVPPGAADRS